MSGRCSRRAHGITATGVRAQAVGVNGALLDDFVVQAVLLRQVYVLNALPAATSALEMPGTLRTGWLKSHARIADAARVPTVERTTRI